MPEQIPDFTVQPRTRRTGQGIQWWMLDNGAVFQFVRGVDFYQSTLTLRSLAHGAAKRHNKTALVSVIDDDHVEIQFVPRVARRKASSAQGLMDDEVRRLRRGGGGT